MLRGEQGVAIDAKRARVGCGMIGLDQDGDKLFEHAPKRRGPLSGRRLSTGGRGSSRSVNERLEATE